MSRFYIEDADLQPVKDKVVVLTGGSSGLGLATTKVLLEFGAHVVVGDMNPVPIEHDRLAFQTTNVTSWADLVSLFKFAKQKHSRIDHVFSNAGIAGRADYLADKYDEATGELLEPSTLTYDINLRGMINTSYLGLHHMRHQDPPGGSIVCTASGSSFQYFGVPDYTTAKHGVLGWMRGMMPRIRETKVPVRINCVAPSWTITGLVPREFIQGAGVEWQHADVVGRQVALLMADESRQGQFIYSSGGRNYETEYSVFIPAARKVNEIAEVPVPEDEARARLAKLTETHLTDTKAG